MKRNLTSERKTLRELFSRLVESANEIETIMKNVSPNRAVGLEGEANHQDFYRECVSLDFRGGFYSQYRDDNGVVYEISFKHMENKKWEELEQD